VCNHRHDLRAVAQELPQARDPNVVVPENDNPGTVHLSIT
jgi:hypothetical protein